MKAVLSGAWIEGFLSLRTFGAKLFGVILAAGAGLVVGLEGLSSHPV
jgi:H+/Cl- antiporter ClcA